MCNRNVGGSSRYLVLCFQQCFWGNIIKFFIYEGVEAYYVFRSSSFLLPNIFSNLQGFGNPICNLGDLYWVDLDLSYSDTHKYLPLLLWFLEGWFQNESMGCNSTTFLWKIKLSLQQKEGSNDQVGPKYYASSVGVPCCHCRMDKSFFKKALRYHTKNFFQDKSSVGNTFPEKNGWIKSNKTGKNLYARLRTVRVCCVNQPPI